MRINVNKFEIKLTCFQSNKKIETTLFFVLHLLKSSMYQALIFAIFVRLYVLIVIWEYLRMYIKGVMYDVICGQMQLQCSSLVHNMNIGYAYDAVEENMIKQVFYDNARVIKFQ